MAFITILFFFKTTPGYNGRLNRSPRMVKMTELGSPLELGGPDKANLQPWLTVQKT